MKSIAVAVLVSFAPGAFAQEAPSGSFAEGFARGESEANAVPTFGWGVGGFGGGCLLGCLGCLGVTGAAYVVDPTVPRHLILDKQFSADYQMGFTQGYDKRLKKRRATSAFAGGTLGVVVVAVTYAVIVASQPPPEDEQQQALPLLRF